MAEDSKPPNFAKARRLLTTRAIAGITLLAAGAPAPHLPAVDVDGSGATAKTGGQVSLRMRGREMADKLPPLDHPTYRDAKGATHMRDEDLVLGLVVSGHARAYPWWVMKNYHVVNDSIGGTPVAVAFCEQCSGGAAFRRERPGRVLSMTVAGVYNGTILLEDRETRTLWAPFSGRAIEGPLHGETLDRIPLSLAHWDEWVARHPQTDVVWASPSARNGHGSWYRAGKWGIVTEMGATLETWDARLPENTLVYGVEELAGGKAYPLSQLVAHRGVVNDEVGATAVVIVATGDLEAAGYERTLDGRRLTFRAATVPGGVMSDHETGTLWSVEGEAVSGPLRGQRLRALNGYTVEWHVWSAYNPRTAIFEPAASERHVSVPEGLVFPRLVLESLGGKGRGAWCRRAR